MSYRGHEVMKPEGIGFKAPGSHMRDESINAAQDASAEAQPRLTIVLPKAVFDQLQDLAFRRSMERGEQPVMTTAIAGESHPLHSTGRGVR